MKRDLCSACGCSDLHQFLDLGESPIADAYTAGPDDTPPTYPLQVAVCGKCHLVQLLEVVDHEVLFGTGYSFYTSASPPLSAYHQRYAADVLARHGNLAQRLVVEVGCNDGDLLRHFAAAACPALGVDPASGPAATAVDRGLDVLVAPFGTAIAKEVRDLKGPAGIIVANHVLAHVADVADVLAGISHLLADDGIAMVEVQYLPDLLTNNAFDLVYHEHRNFFSLTSLRRAAERWDLHVRDAELTDRQGGSLRVTLTKGHGQAGPASRVFALLGSEQWLRDQCAYDGMQGRIERIRTRLWDLLADEKLAGHTVAGYGAPAKATTLLNWCGINNRDLMYVVDTTPAKQGRHIPGTGLRIVAPTAPVEPPDAFLLLSWNYAQQIMRNNPGPRWILPVPAPVLL